MATPEIAISFANSISSDMLAGVMLPVLPIEIDLVISELMRFSIISDFVVSLVIVLLFGEW